MVLVCDIQGVGDVYTDPQMHTLDGYALVLNPCPPALSSAVWAACLCIQSDYVARQPCPAALNSSVFHTISRWGFGRGNLGVKGFERFLQTHRCNAICHYFRLPSVNKKVFTKASPVLAFALLAVLASVRKAAGRR